jgi:signal peptidase I
MQMTAAGTATSAQSLASAQDTSTIATLQSLIVAFVLAMTFRGFVTEGFVIPTGSMAPTLMGEHLYLRSDQTGYSYAADAKGSINAPPACDPMLGRRYPLTALNPETLRPRGGDRILVLKCLYPFAEPHRFDVVVFKNPTEPDGDAENYIKRLVGLPDESIWLVDGDVFVAPASSSSDPGAYRIQRKPEHVQRAVWQPVHDSDFVPLHPERLSPPHQPPWSGASWQSDGRTYRSETAEPSELSWDIQRMPISDWTAYNTFLLAGRTRLIDDYNVSDVSVSAAIVADRDGLATALELEARGYIYEFSIAGGHAVTRLRPKDQTQWTAEQSVEAPMPRPGRVYNVEFWHVDQSMSIFVNGKRVGPPLAYNWDPRERVERSYPMAYESWLRQTPMAEPTAPQLRWKFSGSPVAIHRVRVGRDLYFRPDRLSAQATTNVTRGGFEELVRPGTPAFGTHPSKPAVLGPDQYFMLGDNSPASSDSRLWGYPHPYVAEQVDPSPFVVDRKLLLGKAWVVYFPAPYPVMDNGKGLVPDFGNLRFIR